MFYWTVSLQTHLSLPHLFLLPPLFKLKSPASAVAFASFFHFSSSCSHLYFSLSHYYCLFPLPFTFMAVQAQYPSNVLFLNCRYASSFPFNFSIHLLFHNITIYLQIAAAKVEKNRMTILCRENSLIIINLLCCSTTEVLSVSQMSARPF